MPAYVIDTNVGVVANGKDCPQADPVCKLACIEKLKECVEFLNGKKQGHVVIDSGNEIFEEYRSYFDFKGQPGVGDMFFKVLHERRFSTDNCERVTIKPDAEWGYEEFPHDEALDGFDPSDRKFVAVAVKSHHSPVILNAIDSDWQEDAEALEKYVKVEELCPNCLKKLQWNRGFDTIKRYEGLREFLRNQDLKEEATWIDLRLKRLRSNPLNHHTEDPKRS